MHLLAKQLIGRAIQRNDIEMLIKLTQDLNNEEFNEISKAWSDSAREAAAEARRGAKGEGANPHAASYEKFGAKGVTLHPSEKEVIAKMSNANKKDTEILPKGSIAAISNLKPGESHTMEIKGSPVVNSIKVSRSAKEPLFAKVSVDYKDSVASHIRSLASKGSEYRMDPSAGPNVWKVAAGWANHKSPGEAYRNWAHWL